MSYVDKLTVENYQYVAYSLLLLRVPHIITDSHLWYDVL